MTQNKKFEIQCSDDLLNKIEEHCFSSTKTEVGGFLVGTVAEGKSTVTHVLKAKHTANTQSQLTFTNKTWETAFTEMSEISGEAQLIGWFHSHPNFGVFLSDYDKFIQNEFFNKDGMITIVVDPINGKRGWFISIDKEVRPYDDEEDTTLEKLGLKKDDKDSADNGVEMKSKSANSGVSIGRTIAIAGVFSLFSILANFGITGGQSGNIDKAGLQNQIDLLQLQVAQLQLQLNPENLEPTPTPQPSTPSKSQSPAPSKSSTVKKSSPKAVTQPKSLQGTPCPKENTKRVEAGKSFNCVKTDNKLVWQQITVKKNSPTPKPTSTQGPANPSQPNTSQPNSSQPSSSPSVDPTPTPTPKNS